MEEMKNKNLKEFIDSLMENMSDDNKKDEILYKYYKENPFSPTLIKNIIDVMDELDDLIYIAQTGKRLLDNMDNAVCNYDGKLNYKTFEEKVKFEDSYKFLINKFVKTFSYKSFIINDKIEKIRESYNNRKKYVDKFEKVVVSDKKDKSEPSLFDTIMK